MWVWIPNISSKLLLSVTFPGPGKVLRPPSPCFCIPPLRWYFVECLLVQLQLRAFWCMSLHAFQIIWLIFGNFSCKIAQLDREIRFSAWTDRSFWNRTLVLFILLYFYLCPWLMFFATIKIRGKRDTLFELWAEMTMLCSTLPLADQRKGACCLQNVAGMEDLR